MKLILGQRVKLGDWYGRVMNPDDIYELDIGDATYTFPACYISVTASPEGVGRMWVIKGAEGDVGMFETYNTDPTMVMGCQLEIDTSPLPAPTRRRP